MGYSTPLWQWSPQQENVTCHTTKTTHATSHGGSFRLASSSSLSQFLGSLCGVAAPAGGACSMSSGCTWSARVLEWWFMSNGKLLHCREMISVTHCGFNVSCCSYSEGLMGITKLLPYSKSTQNSYRQHVAVVCKIIATPRRAIRKLPLPHFSRLQAPIYSKVRMGHMKLILLLSVHI